MSANKIINIEPTYVADTATNILNTALSSLSGPTGYTQTQPYLILRHIRLTNSSGSAVSVTLYKGETGASTGGTEFAFAGVSVPANSYVDWYGAARFDYGDYLVGKAGSGSVITFTAEGEIGLS